MSCDIDSDSFHGTKAGGVRKTARRAFKKPLRIARSLRYLTKELNSLYEKGIVPEEDYNLLRTCLSHYKEYQLEARDKRFKIREIDKKIKARLDRTPRARTGELY